MPAVIARIATRTANRDARTTTSIASHNAQRKYVDAGSIEGVSNRSLVRVSFPSSTPPLRLHDDMRPAFYLLAAVLVLACSHAGTNLSWFAAYRMPHEAGVRDVPSRSGSSACGLAAMDRYEHKDMTVRRHPRRGGGRLAPEPRSRWKGAAARFGGGLCVPEAACRVRRGPVGRRRGRARGSPRR